MNDSSDPLPDFMGSPIPILTWRRVFFRAILNNCCLLMLRIKTILIDQNDYAFIITRVVSQGGFPWLTVSVLFSVNLLLIDNSEFRKFMKDIPSFYNLLLGTRVAMMLFVLKNRGRDDLFMDIDSIVTDVLQVIFWGSIGFKPSFVVPFCAVETVGVLVRVAFFRSLFVSKTGEGSHYSILQLNLASAVVIGLYLLVCAYLVAATFNNRMITTALTKLREYISRFTLQKNPTLHLVYFLLPPLVKSIMETASRHDESPSFKSESNARRIITAANQVLLLPRAVEMHLRAEWRVLQFHSNNLIDVQRLLDGVIERLPSTEEDYQSQHTYAHKNKMMTRNCDMLVFCNTKYLTFILETVLTYSLAVNRRKRAESKGKQSRSKTPFVIFQAAKIKAELEVMQHPDDNASNIINNTNTVHDKNFFGGKGNINTATAVKVVKICPILFDHEVKAGEKPDDENTDKQTSAEEDDVQTMYKTSLGLSAIKKILKAFGGSLSIREHHDVKEEGTSTHLIVLSIPCRLPVVNQDTANDFKHDIWRSSRSTSMANVKDIVNVSRQIIDFGMDTQNDDWFEHTVEIFALFSMRIKRVTDKFSYINLYRVIFISSYDRCADLRELGYKGQLVLLTSRSEHRAGHVPEGVDFSLEIPYTLCAMDRFFREISQHQTLSRQPHLLTFLDKVIIRMKPHQHIPIISWASQILRYLNHLEPYSLFFDVSRSASATSLFSAAPVQHPATLAYTPISSRPSLHSSTTGGVEDIDLEYLTNNKVVASTQSYETFQIADNYLDESVFPEMTSSTLSEFLRWRLLNLFWTTNHDFKPHFSSFSFKRYSCADSFLNVYPFVGLLFFKLCVFLIFTAFDTRFNYVWSVVYCVHYLIVICLLLMKPYPKLEYSHGWRLRIRNIVMYMKYSAVPTVFVMDILRLFVAIAPGRCSWDNKGGGQCGTYSIAELLFCFCLNPLMLFFLWTASTVTSAVCRILIVLQMGFSALAVHFYLGPMINQVHTVALLMGFLYGMVSSELRRSAARSRSLYLELRYPLKELLESQKYYYQLCLDETLRGEASLTQELMDEMAHFRRTFLFLREIQKHFTLQENLEIDVDRECYTAIADGVEDVTSSFSSSSSAPPPQNQPKRLPGRRLESFHLIGELTELCRCFESLEPVPVRVFIKVCPSLSITVRMDKELLISFLVNVMYQSLSNIRNFPYAHPNTSDLVHEIVILVSKHTNTSEAGSGRNQQMRMHDMNDHADAYLDITLLDTGLNNVLTKHGLLAGEGFPTESGMRWNDGNSSYSTCSGFDQPFRSFGGGCSSNSNSNSNNSIWATVYVQLQEYLFRKAVQIVGGQFKRLSVTRVHSSYMNEVSVSLPMYSHGSTALLPLPVPSPSSAAHVMSNEYSQYREISSYYKIIYDKMTWRWQSLCQKLGSHSHDPANNFLGYGISTSEPSYTQNSRTRKYNKYATMADIHSRRILIVVDSKKDAVIPADSFRQQGWKCTVTTSFEKLLSYSFHFLNRFDVILVTNEFNQKCVSEGHKEMRNLFENLFFGYSPLHVPFVVCLVNSIAEDAVLMQPCHWCVERPFVDNLIDKIVLECDKYALKKLFY